MHDGELTDWKLLSPFLFLRLSYEEKSTYALVSLVVSIVATVAFAVLPIQPALFGSEGFLSDIQSLVTILFPFLVASLVAVATFSKETLDKPPIGGQVKLVRVGYADYILKRREFVSLLFAYCSASSLGLFIAILIAKALRASVLIWLPAQTVLAFKIILVFIVSFVFAHLLISTFWGLYYLMYRINR